MENLSGPGRFIDVRWVAETGSTNADVLASGRDGAAEGVVVVADVQTAGRGRHGREWVAPAGSGLLFSVLLRPNAEVVDLVTAAAALAVDDAVATLGVRGTWLKWPNDIMATVVDASTGDAVDRKLVGILAEADWPVGVSPASGPRRVRADERVLVALGIGLNVARIDGGPPDVAARRVSVEELIGVEVDRRALLATVLARLESWYRRLSDDRDAVLDAWRRRCATLGKPVRVDLGADELVGTAVDVDATGRLVVRSTTGVDHVVAAGDVVHLRDVADIDRL
ncbi:MAG: biotin--[acetyl-CoA-carboxylase] ligase [Actinobacteria bacterium]|nr:biotin--[acetyl-CoA-carboxylase] ligase [Actinomycetota bacterium]